MLVRTFFKTSENSAIGEDLCPRVKITDIINKCDMNLNFMFHVLIHVHVSAREAFYLTAYISRYAIGYIFF